MLRAALACLVLCAAVAHGCQPLSPKKVKTLKQHLFPLPRTVSSGNETLTLASSLGFRLVAPEADRPLLDAAAQRFLSVAHFCGLTADGPNAVSEAAIIVEADATWHKEEYEMAVRQSGILIRAATTLGARHALTTLRQLLEYHAGDMDGYSIHVPNAPWVIRDAPAFDHRGVMIDTSRSWIPIPLIMRTLEGMAYVKLNVLHWHMVDATSFPFESKSHPNLTKYGAYQPDQIYHLANISAILAYATQLGITIVPEVDTPGHSFVWGVGYPSVVECNQEKDQLSAMCPEPPCGNIRVADAGAVGVVHDVYRDLIDAFPGNLVHVGADEVSSMCWGPDTPKLFADYEVELHKLVTGAGRTMVVWGGAITDFKIPLPPNSTIIQTWDSNKMVPLSQGYRVIDSDYKNFYLDCGEGNWISGGNSWCDPFKSWYVVYSYNPLAGVPPEYHQQVLGGEVCLWGEIIDENNFETKLWPRAAAAAERLWDNPANPDMISALHRLRTTREALLAMGIAVTPLQPRYCSTSNFCDVYH